MSTEADTNEMDPEIPPEVYKAHRDMHTIPMQIGPYPIGPPAPCFIVAEIGINHNGDLDIARSLIDVAAAAGCQAVKFQKRTVNAVYSPDDLRRPRKSLFGKTNGDLKWGLEFHRDEYKSIARRCEARGVLWGASCWDPAAVAFCDRFPSFAFHKVASACLTDDDLLRAMAESGRPIIVSTGMSTMRQVRHAVTVLQESLAPFALLHCCSAYPAPVESLNLACLPSLRAFGVPTGYSGHEDGTAPTLAAVALGACIVERHITLDRKLWGSDQGASLEPSELARLVKDIREIEVAMGRRIKDVEACEVPVMEKLRRVQGNGNGSSSGNGNGKPAAENEG